MSGRSDEVIVKWAAQVDSLLSGSFAEQIHGYIRTVVLARTGKELQDTERVIFELKDGSRVTYKPLSGDTLYESGLVLPHRTVLLPILDKESLQPDSEVLSVTQFGISTIAGSLDVNQIHQPKSQPADSDEQEREIEIQDELGLSLPTFVDWRNFFALLYELGSAPMAVVPRPPE